MDKRELVEKREQYLLPCYAHYFQDYLYLTRGEGQFIYDDQGRRYLDCFAGVAVVNCGHARAEIRRAVDQQMNQLVHTSSLMLTEPMVTLAEKLAAIAPGKLQKSFFCNSGAEAVEGATALVKAATDNHQFIALRSSFHGRTLMALSLTAQRSWRGKGPYAPGIIFVANPYCYRCVFKLRYPSCGLACAEDIDEAIRTSTNGKIAGFIAEPIQGNGGVVVPPKEYFAAVSQIIKRYDGLFIDDDVQTGFGRTGKWFGIEHFGVEPDVMTLGKGIANGLPLGAFIATPDVAPALGLGQHFSTFGGNPVNCAAAIANIELLEKEDLIGNADRVGSYFLAQLGKLADTHQTIGEVRGLGLMIGIELVKDRANKEPHCQGLIQLVEYAREHGLLLGKSGLHANVVRITPPLCFRREDVDQACEILEAGLCRIDSIA
ncbi:MAG: aspartate aminotransferase family protein [bacterium]